MHAVADLLRSVCLTCLWLHGPFTWCACCGRPANEECLSNLSWSAQEQAKDLSKLLLSPEELRAQNEIFFTWQQQVEADAAAR